MKKIITAGVATLALTLGACGTGYSNADLDLARSTCKNAVQNKAKHPGGVDFVSQDEAVEATEYGGVDYEIAGEVDFVNSFNTPVRHEYWCHVGANDGDTGRPEVTVEPR